ncbi:MAG: hypothetical protein JSW63_11335 [Ignavibacterium sp.]|nr:MAG: hypothetical protein JSW63_11335 [Ignavibacterium sp.]
MDFNHYKKIFYVIISFVITTQFLSCTSVSQETVMMKDVEGIKMTAAELGIRLNEFGKYFISKTEQASEEIRVNSDDITIKKNALQWRLNAIPAAIHALSIVDPVAAGVDTWALCAQQQQFFIDGYGKNLFGEYQYIAIEASTELMNEMERIADDFRDSKYRGEFTAAVDEWNAKYPIKDLNFHRRSTLDLMAKGLGSQEYSLGTTVGSIAIGVHDIRKQITLYTDLLPKQIKWQAQYTAYEIFGDSTVGNIMDNFNIITKSTKRLTDVIEETPSLAEELRESSLSNINQQRIATLQAVTNERIAILKAITAERIAIMEDINTKRDETLDKLAEMTNDVINRSSFFAVDIINTIFWRILILLAIAFVGLVLLIKIKKQIEK